jgi:NADPH-dependent 2,4-dienoyl-CoA reductase/sulfur reductase-like enzyme/rhodanese-related sulfurtransferase
MKTRKKRILIIGGVAGGASCAARLRRLCEQCEIYLIDKGEYVSFANCGLPYYVGDVITDRKDLIVATPDKFEKRFNIRVRTRHQAMAINRQSKTVTLKNLQTGEQFQQDYDALVLSTGASPIKPPLPGIDLPGVYQLRTIPDSQRLKAAAKNAKRAVIIGGGFIGLEMVENLSRLGLEVTLIERGNQVMSPLDPEMASYVKQTLEAHGIQVLLNTHVTAFSQDNDNLTVHCEGQHDILADIVLLAIGVRPSVELAEQAGIKLGQHGGIIVTEQQQTSDPAIWAIGDVVENKDWVLGSRHPLPLAGPANRQGRIAAASILESFQPLAQRKQFFRGVQGTAVCKIFELTVAMTGANEKTLMRNEKTYQAIYLHPGHHVGYFPGAKPIHIKMIYQPDNGKLLGIQAIGEAGVSRRVDVFSMAMQMNGTVLDLEEAELCYAPQFGAAKDPINLAGMIAANHLRQDLQLADWRNVYQDNHLVLDVRSDAEYQEEHIEGAINIPLEHLREKIDTLNADQEVWVVCGVGQRAYYAVRFLIQAGFQVKILSGGMKTWRTFKDAGLLPSS